MEKIVIEFLEKQDFTGKEQKRIKNFFQTKNFFLKGQIYLISLLAYAKKRKNLNKIFMFLDFLWNTTWRYNPTHSRVNLTINPIPRANILVRKERRYFHEICKAVKLPLDLKKLQKLWGDDFEKLPASVKSTEINNTRPKKKKKKITKDCSNLSPEEKLLKNIFGDRHC